MGLDDLFKKGEELMGDPQNQEKLKNLARERFGGGGSKGAGSDPGQQGDRMDQTTESPEGADRP